MVGEGMVGEGVVGEGVGTLLLGLVLVARRNPKISPVVTIDVERTITRRNTKGFRGCFIVEHVSIALLLLTVQCLMQLWCGVLFYAGSYFEFGGWWR
jgi:hypothetical protein